ncbi:MAG: glutaredoxin domain-containing protein [Pseudobdellovibrionaceae bacterium]
MAKVIMYSKDPCPYCVNAKRLLDEKGVKYEVIDLTDRPEEMQKIKDNTGWRTVPIIVIDGNLIGGYSDMKALDDEGKLDSMLA